MTIIVRKIFLCKVDSKLDNQLDMGLGKQTGFKNFCSRNYQENITESPLQTLFCRINKFYKKYNFYRKIITIIYFNNCKLI